MPQIIAPDEAGDSPGDYPAEMSSYWPSNGLLAQLIHSRGAVGLEIRCLLCQRFDGAVLMPPIVCSKPRPLAPHYLSQQLAPNVDPNKTIASSLQWRACTQLSTAVESDTS